MADEMKGIDKLRKLAGDMNQTPLWMSLRLDREGDYGGRSNAIRLTKTLNDLADQIEREHAEETAASKRDLADEAREAVERLRAVSHDDILRSANPDFEIVREIGNAVGASWIPTYTSKFDAISDRIIELIEHGGKQDVDVAALLELADDLESLEVSASSAEFASGYEDGCEYAAERIRKVVEGAPKPDAESDSERACAALLDWRDQVAGLLGIDCGSMADEVQDAIMAELDKRLMPPGMEWPRFEGGERVEFGDAWLDAVGSPHVLHGVEFRDGKAAEMGARVIMRGRTCSNDDFIEYNLWPGERVKRPEPEVRGADGKPIKVGETVYDGTGNRHVVVEVDTDRALVEFDGEPKRGWRASFITHTPPDTKERIDEDKLKMHDAYWGCCGIVCGDCPAVIDGMKPYEYYGVLNCRVAQGMDIARRKHELDAKTMGGAR